MNDKQEQFDDNLMMTNNDLKPVAAGRNHSKSVLRKNNLFKVQTMHN